MHKVSGPHYGQKSCIWLAAPVGQFAVFVTNAIATTNAQRRKLNLLASNPSSCNPHQASTHENEGSGLRCNRHITRDELLNAVGIRLVHVSYHIKSLGVESGLSGNSRVAPVRAVGRYYIGWERRRAREQAPDRSLDIRCFVHVGSILRCEPRGLAIRFQAGRPRIAPDPQAAPEARHVRLPRVSIPNLVEEIHAIQDYRRTRACPPKAVIPANIEPKCDDVPAIYKCKLFRSASGHGER